MSKTKKSEYYSWGEILDSFKRGVLGSDEDFDDDFEDVEVEKDEKPKSAEQTDKKTEESAKPVQKPASKPAQKPAVKEADKDSNSVFCSSLQTDLNTFVQTGTASDPLLQLLKEGFDKNPDLLEEVAKYIAARRRGVEKIHPGFLVSYKGGDSMLLSKEKVLDFILSRPGAIVRETIFVSLVKDGKTVSTREATEEEKKLYFEQKTSKADASGPEGQDY
jgi:hypothetical protein